jgi:hypothetical protein
MKRHILTALVSILFLYKGALAQKRKDLNDKKPEPSVSIEHPVKKDGTPTEHANGDSKKAKLEHGTREAHPPKTKAGVEAEHPKSGTTVHRKGSKQGQYKKPVKKD